MDASPTPSPTSRAWIWQIALSVVALVLITAVGGVMGYGAKSEEDAIAQATQAMMPARAAAQEQFALGVEALESQRFLEAKTHLEYAMLVDPSLPDIDEKLAEALIGIYSEPTPTPMPDPAATAVAVTPVIPNAAELLFQAQDLINNGEWSLGIEVLQNLRFFHPEYQPTVVDGLFFSALYNRGMERVGAGDLGGGVYDLEGASRFGSLGAEGQNYLEWASFYLAGVSYWKLDWGKAAYYFGLVVDAAPDFQDSSGVSVRERYREAAQEYAQLLAEKDDWCEAERYFRIAVEHGGEDNGMLDYSAERCAAGEG